MLRQKLKKVKWIKFLYDRFRIWSIREGLNQDRELKWSYEILSELEIDIENQYTSTKIDTEYLKLKVQFLHAFQMMLFEFVFDNWFYDEGDKIDIEDFRNIRVIDMGDSAGTHSQYIKNIFGVEKIMSINIDPVAVDKIRSKELRAVKLDIEELNDLTYYEYWKKVDVALMFQTLEHIKNPVKVLELLKSRTEYLIVTVPYVKRSRIGMHHLRDPEHSFFVGGSPEDVHIFELSPEDWKLLFNYTGWEVKYESIYYQYPRWLFPLKWYWRKFDFEGFYGVVLKRKEI